MKKILSTIGILVIAVVLWFVLTMDARIKDHIEETATYLAGVPVTIANVEISLLKGTGKISGLTVGNPEGFSKGNAIEMGSIRVELNPGAVFSQPLIFNILEFESPVLNLEINDKNYSNLQEIVSVSNKQNNVQDKNGQLQNKQGQGNDSSDQTDAGNSKDQSSSTESEAESGEVDDDFRMVFKQLNLLNITLNARRGSDQWTETIAEVKLEDVGQEEGIGTRELGITIVRMLASRALAIAAQRSLTDIVEEKVKEFGSKLLESLLQE
jgi:uncharacterized protein involved in outer membrane biogenesis